jgi:MFS family permease
LEKYRMYPYRWVILLCVVPILAVTQMFWLTFSPIADVVSGYYHVSSLSIAFLSMSYMIVYIIVTIPASLLADKKGFRICFLAGAVITAVFGMLRGLFASSFPLVMAFQVGVAVGQPFLVNPITKLAATWFPVNERATASGIATMAGYIGMIVAMVVTPELAGAMRIGPMMMLYGYISVASAIIVIIFIREKPKTPAGPGGEVLSGFGIRDIAGVVKNRSFILLMIIMFIALGIFNALMTCINDILTPRGISASDAGLIGGVIVLVGLVGAIVIPVFSDRLRKRRLPLIISIGVALPGIIGIAFFPDFGLIVAAAAVAGFFMMGAGPVAFQYGAEIAYPLPEGTSYGLLMVMGQISGILFTNLMYALRPKSGSMSISLSILIVIMAAGLLLSFKLRESRIIAQEGNAAEGE